MTDSAIEFSQLYRRFRGFTLGPLDFEIPTGKITALIGPNGSGKSTLINALMGFDPRAGGRIRILGMDHRKEEVEIRRRLGFVGEQPILFNFTKLPWLVDYVRGFYPTWDADYCVELATRFQLPTDRRISKFSKGMKVRTALLLALSHRPDILVLDEPTSGLDAEVRRDVMEQIGRVVESETRTVFMTGHNLLEIERIADRIVMISGGQIHTQGDKHELVERHRAMTFSAEADIDLPEDLILSVESDDHRVRVETCDHERLALELERAGARDIESQPMTLEDIFVAVVRKGKNGDG